MMDFLVFILELIGYGLEGLDYIIDKIRRWIIVHLDWDMRVERFRKRRERITDEERNRRI